MPDRRYTCRTSVCGTRYEFQTQAKPEVCDMVSRPDARADNYLAVPSHVLEQPPEKLIPARL